MCGNDKKVRKKSGNFPILLRIVMFKFQNKDETFNTRQSQMCGNDKKVPDRQRQVT